MTDPKPVRATFATPADEDRAADTAILRNPKLRDMLERTQPGYVEELERRARDDVDDDLDEDAHAERARMLNGRADDDDDAPLDVKKLLGAFGIDPAGLQLEQQLGGMLTGAFQQLRAAGGAGPLEALERRTTTEDGREVRLVVAPVEGFAKTLAPLGGIEGVTEMMLISFGATTETEGDPLMADVALALRNAEPIDLTIRTPRHAVRFSMVNAASWANAQALELELKNAKPAATWKAPPERPLVGVQRPKAKPAKTQPRDVPSSVVLPPMLRRRVVR